MATLPTGTVSLLFTDIEGSTRLWETQPDAMRAALARHDAILRHCIDERRGHVFKTGGDAFCAVFATAPDALSAALDAQRALAREPWPEGARLRVRMAMHAGAIELRDGDYFGAPLNRVARLLAAGHGGQTLLSEAMHNLVRDHMPPLATTRSLGAHALKDLARSESVFQLEHPELASQFPPLRADAAVAPSVAPGAEREAPSIAVLPFVNMSRDEENEYFADGLSEELLNVLAKIRGLRVASRTSAFSFKGSNVDIPTIARKLNVRNVLEGSVRKSGARVRITAQLIEVGSDSHLWSETYDRQLDDVFAVQDDIAQSVVKELRTMLMGASTAATAAAAASDVERANAGRTSNPEAYELYLRGKVLAERLTQQDTNAAIVLLKRALELDPQFALAWVSLARAHSNQAGYGFAGIDEGQREARKALDRALAIAPDLPEALTAYAWHALSYEWDWEAARAASERALELAPGSGTAMLTAAAVRRVRGESAEGLRLAERARDLDRLSSKAHTALAFHYFGLERLPEAEAALRASLALEPDRAVTRSFLAYTRVFQGKLDAETEALVAAEPHPVFRLLGECILRHAQGNEAASRTALQALIDGYGWTGAYQVAVAYAVCGDRDQAIHWLETAYRQHDPGMQLLSIDPAFSTLRDDPRVLPLLRKMGYAD
ncbi:MAG: hypothetical protein JSR18_14215 [Proteobacteria bacterium]|nr:hypothetical protein [Pseudomonadota bacterium]